MHTPWYLHLQLLLIILRRWLIKRDQLVIKRDLSSQIFLLYVPVQRTIYFHDHARKFIYIHPALHGLPLMIRPFEYLDEGCFNVLDTTFFWFQFWKDILFLKASLNTDQSWPYFLGQIEVQWLDGLNKPIIFLWEYLVQMLKNILKVLSGVNGLDSLLQTLANLILKGFLLEHDSIQTTLYILWDIQVFLFFRLVKGTTVWCIPDYIRSINVDFLFYELK